MGYNMKKLKSDKFGRYGEGRRLWTVFTKDVTCRRGEYAEELDIFADTPGCARKLAKKILNEYYDPELRISRVELVY
jgi:hypothetical protein